MPWFRRPTGELVHAVGGLEVVYEDRGWEIVEDEAAVAEVAAVTPRSRGPKPLLKVKHRAAADLTKVEKKRVRKAVADEGHAPRMDWDS